MSESTKSSGKRKSQKPYPEFPLTAHPSGRWCKKRRGKQYDFGRIDDWQAARERYERECPQIIDGRTPPPVDVGEGCTMRDLCKSFLTSKRSKLDSGELSAGTFDGYHRMGRDSIPPGRYFRMLFVGYFEEIDSQRGIAWRCADSLSLRNFLFLDAAKESPDHSSLTKIRQRLPLLVHEEVFAFVLDIARQKKLLVGKQVGVDATTLEANAAMKSIVRRDSGEDWKDYLRRLAEEAGVEIKNDEDLRRFDKQRKKQGKKKVKNDEWVSESDPESRIIKLKDGRTHLGYKAEHVVDLESEYVLAATVYEGTDGDGKTLVPSLVAAQTNLIRAGSDAEIQDAVADKGYHANQTLVDCEQVGVRTYIPERETGKRRWSDKPPEMESAFRNNRRRMHGDKGKRLGRKRSELVERSFAHVCETGGARRTWLRGKQKINKRYLIHVAAQNLGLLMRDLFGIGKPRVLQGGLSSCFSADLAVRGVLTAHWASLAVFGRPQRTRMKYQVVPAAA